MSAEIRHKAVRVLWERLGVNDDADPPSATVTVENIGGIGTCTVDLSPGVTVLSGENATNRTSLLKALNGVLGGSMAAVRTDADEGEVKIVFDGGPSYSRVYRREGGRTSAVGGDPFSADETIVDGFVTLLESNPARRAVERGEDLRDVLMSPVDTDEIEREIREKTSERDELKDRLQYIDRQRENEARLVERREELKDRLGDLEDVIEEKEAVVSQYEADMDMAAEAEELVEELESARERAHGIEDEIEVLDAELEALNEEEGTLEEELGELDDSVGEGSESRGDLQQRVKTLQARKNDFTEVIDELTRIIRFNKGVVDDADRLPGVVSEGSDSVVSGLDPDAEVTVECWTCGSEVGQGEITDRTEALQDLVDEKRSELKEISSELDEVRDQINRIESVQDERESIERRLSGIEREKESVVSEREEYGEKLEAVRAEISELQEEVAETEELRESDLLDAYEELGGAQHERGMVESDLESVVEEIEEIDELKGEREGIEDRLDDLQSELEELRTRVERLEEEAVESFNEHMEEVLDLLAYENVERVWIERQTSSAGTNSPGEFILHVVRESGGSVYEDVVDNLSESEREVIGLVVALAGYLVHEVYEEVPFILLDSVEAIDASRLDDLLAYIEEYALYVPVALLPEDAETVSAEFDRVPADALS